MAKIVVSGIRPWDGEYDLDTDRPFNAREWRWIKKISGYMPLTVAEGWEGGDPDLIVALAVIAMNRDGRIDREQGLAVAELLAEAPYDGAAITLDGGQEDADDVPLEQTNDPDGSSRSDSLLRPSTSGDSSRNGSDLSDATRPRTSVLKSHT